MCRLISAAVRASTSSRSRDELTPSPISVRVANTSAGSGVSVVSGATSTRACPGFITYHHYSRRNAPSGRRCTHNKYNCSALDSKLGQRFLTDLDAIARTDARCPGVHHVQQIIQRANATRGLDAYFAPNLAPHQLHIPNRCSGSAEARRRFYEIRPCITRRAASAHFFLFT